MTYKFAGVIPSKQSEEQDKPVYLGVMPARFGEEFEFGFYCGDGMPVGILLRFSRKTGKLYRLSGLLPSLVSDLDLSVDETGRITIVG